jgi:hypothetical protein
MATQRLVIDSDDPGQFLLLVEGDAVTLDGAGGQRVLQPLRVTRIHCVLEVEANQVTLGAADPDGGATTQELRCGESLETAGVRLVLQPVKEALAPSHGAETDSPAPHVRRRLLVLAGAEPGRDFPLPDSGVVTIGKDRNQVDIALLGFKVERVHCHLKIDADKVEVFDEGSLGTQINGKRITRQELHPGDVLRIGNNQLRLETAAPGEDFPAPPAPRPKAEGDDPRAGDAGEDSSDESADAGEPTDYADSDDAIPLPANASEAVRSLHEAREKLAHLAGQVFGHYQLGSVLGRGRTGVVFQSTEQKSGQATALKVFAPQFPHDNQELQRFTGVMKALLPLRHVNLVSLYGAGKTPTYTWVAREYIAGESVARVIRRLARGAAPDAELACRVGLHVGRALDFAHRRHLRHGGITPANILILQSDQTVKLADLMLAEALAGSQLAHAALEHRSPFDVAFLSPEQATPGAFVDHLSDLYGLGAVLYALVTGRPPFQGDSAAAVLQQIRGPSRAARPTTLNAAIPPALERIVLKLLAKHQEDRYQTPAELLADLEPITSAE